jgi:hypothetical protein
MAELGKRSWEDPRVTKAMIRGMNDPDAEIRARAARGLGQVPLPADAREALMALIPLLSDDARLEGLRAVYHRPWSGSAPPVPETVSLAALEALGALESRASEASPAVAALLGHETEAIRLEAARTLDRIGPDAPWVIARLTRPLGDRSESVRRICAEAILRREGNPDSLDPRVISIILDEKVLYYVNLQKSKFDMLMYKVKRVAPVSITPIGYPSVAFSGEWTFLLGSPPMDNLHYRLQIEPLGSSGRLPLFPWPPPRYCHRSVFGVDYPKEYLGNDETALSEIHRRLLNALTKVAPGFENSLFSCPGGFVLLARMERIEEDGTPLPGVFRWTQGKVPPLSLSDYLWQLFLEKPGFFRVVAFVVTDKQNFGTSDRELPKLIDGGEVLPPEVGRLTFNGRSCYALVYVFKKKRAEVGLPLFHDPLSAKTHLEKAGILAVLGAMR